MVTTWACFVEAIYLLGQSGGFRFQSRLWESRRSRLFELIDLTMKETDDAAVWMSRYQDHPMDLADATLVAISESRGWRKVFTLDTHFYAFRLSDASALEVIMPATE
jgi:predicted nucleic acid-binding protein